MRPTHQAVEALKYQSLLLEPSSSDAENRFACATGQRHCPGLIRAMTSTNLARGCSGEQWV